MSAARQRKVAPASWVVDASGEAIEVGGQCGLYIDMQLEDPAPMVGDWVATNAGSRYLVDHVHVVRRPKQAQQKRYQMRCLRLPKHTEPPEDVCTIWLSWYPRAARR